ncbi:hypothetical protein CCACVL1_17209 [Corchorus capsularis]|uniref:Sieve element occlusion n=1 Tax=Corchorus capsularis TaxID=210143 RepID=A0A1R3HTD7_COCAP|nr:hypothetical protein CCACVL1_17209 [Corchorus capsularis]
MDSLLANMNIISGATATTTTAATATATTITTTNQLFSDEATHGVTSLDDFPGMSPVLDDIHKMSCQMSCNHLGDVEKTLEELVNIVERYSYGAKVVVVVAAFALTFGEFWLLVSHRDDGPFAKSLDLLKGHSLEPDFKVLNKFLKALMDVVHTSLSFLEPPVLNIPDNAPSMADANKFFPQAVSHIIRCVVQLSTILGKKVSYRKGPHRSHPLDQNEQQQHKNIWDLFNITKDHIQIIARFIGIGYDQEIPEKLRNKHVLFLISDLDISIEEINILKLYQRDRSDAYEIIWLPIVDGLSYEKTKFTELEAKMTWTHVVKPCKIEAAVIKYIKREWHFIKNPIAVSLSVKGEVTCLNALPMLLTWGNSAFPFTIENERELWREVDEQSGCKIDLFINANIDRNIASWSRSTETLVCLFGGENMTWIQEFTAKVEQVTKSASVSVKLAYMGKNKGKGLIRRNKLGQEIHVIESEFQLQFWRRLESIVYSKIQQGKSSKTDRVMREVMKVLSYDSSGGEWAIFTMGSEAMVTTDGKMAMKIMSEYDYWKSQAVGFNFLQGLRNHLTKMPLDHGCIHVHMPVLGHTPGIVTCPECFKQMEMYYTYRCCV